MNTPSPAKSNPPVPAAPSRIIVLLVDDRPMVGELVRRLLANEPAIELHFCQSAWNAIKMAMEIKPTIILQDLVMPDVNGLTMLRRYRATPETKDTPVIVLSSKDESMFIEDAIKAGANDYLIKVPSRNDLVACLRKHAGFPPLPATDSQPSPPTA